MFPTALHDKLRHQQMAKITQKIAKPPFRKLIEVWRALSCDHRLCEIIPIYHYNCPDCNGKIAKKCSKLGKKKCSYSLRFS